MFLLTQTNSWKLQARRYWELLYVLVERNLKVRYRGSFLGVYWSVLNPLIMTGIYTAIFGATFASYYDDSLINYIFAAFTGLTVIHFFVGATSQALLSLVENGELLNKIYLPISLFPISMVGANVFQFSVSMLPLLVLITLFKTHSLINLLALIFPLISLALVCTGVSFIVSSLYVFFRDFAYFYELTTFVLWIASPIFYPFDIVPKPVQKILFLNPLLAIINSLRQISLSEELPNLLLIGQSLLNGFLLLGLGWLCFRRWQSQFMDLL